MKLKKPVEAMPLKKSSMNPPPLYPTMVTLPVMASLYSYLAVLEHRTALFSSRSHVNLTEFQ